MGSVASSSAHRANSGYQGKDPHSSGCNVLKVDFGDTTWRASRSTVSRGCRSYVAQPNRICLSDISWLQGHTQASSTVISMSQNLGTVHLFP